MRTLSHKYLHKTKRIERFLHQTHTVANIRQNPPIVTYDHSRINDSLNQSSDGYGDESRKWLHPQ
ncbi:hypothetical protein GA0061078_1491 [Bifidobacterium bohemicum]|uniref:Uncharacterized protein n=1 Tax=Bifidobacterium bohemicum DSM 22767 TaxID=1437606 RepID=A0A086ZGY6_9BIFI|nr:hypothetical protein BBOH_0588 [Bifidobacterium bohemicum DSM 22767]SCC11071.1 hypothetical protein GA0061078_1491 [Bifidobacterium bohemicum]